MIAQASKALKTMDVEPARTPQDVDAREAVVSAFLAALADVVPPPASAEMGIDEGGERSEGAETVSAEATSESVFAAEPAMTSNALGALSATTTHDLMGGAGIGEHVPSTLRASASGVALMPLESASMTNAATPSEALAPATTSSAERSMRTLGSKGAPTPLATHDAPAAADITSADITSAIAADATQSPAGEAVLSRGDEQTLKVASNPTANVPTEDAATSSRASREAPEHALTNESSRTSGTAEQGQAATATTPAHSAAAMNAPANASRAVEGLAQAKAAAQADDAPAVEAKASDAMAPSDAASEKMVDTRPTSATTVPSSNTEFELSTEVEASADTLQRTSEGEGFDTTHEHALRHEASGTSSEVIERTSVDAPPTNEARNQAWLERLQRSFPQADVRIVERGDATEISLRHPELGSIELQLQQQGAGLDVAARANGRAAQALRESERDLRERMRRRGLSLNSLNIHGSRRSISQPRRDRAIDLEA